MTPRAEVEFGAAAVLVMLLVLMMSAVHGFAWGLGNILGRWM